VRHKARDPFEVRQYVLIDITIQICRTRQEAEDLCATLTARGEQPMFGEIEAWAAKNRPTKKEGT
jgi:hypothetical protein